MLKVSFILPCYNVEPYIGRCLDSILHQDMPIEEYEIICINDFSPDNLREVIINYQKKYPNIKLIEHSENKTPGGARNTGIDTAKGEYLWFVDPDDMIVGSCVEMFYHLAVKNCADILFFNFQSLDHNVSTKYEIFKDCLVGHDGVSFVRSVFPQKKLAGISAIWHSIIRREFCVNNSIRFPEIKSSEDVVFIWKCIFKSNSVISLNTIGYTVCVRSNSMTRGGKFKSDSIFSATILYTYELLNLLEDYSEEIPMIFKNDILKEIQLSLNDDSRKILQSTIYHKLKFYKFLLPNKMKIDRLTSYMNNNTIRIFDYDCNFYAWLLFVEWFRIKRFLKNLWMR